MKNIQLVPASGPVGLCPDAFHQVCVAFRIKHDGDFTPPDITVTSSSASRVFPTRVVPYTTVWPTRSPEPG